MSKAFTSEGDTPQSPLGVLPEGRRPITQAGLVRHQQELRELLDVTRPALLSAAMDNDAHARGRLRTVEWRIQVLNRLLSLFDPAPNPGFPPSKVALGTRVRIRDDAAKETSYTIVGPDELDGGRQLVSHASPLGRALLGLEVGAWAVIERPAGPYEVEVVAIDGVDGHAS